MAKVTPQDIILINQIYYRCKNKAQTARETGFSPSTVAKYINPNFSTCEVAPVTNTPPKVTKDLFPWNTTLHNWNSFLDLTKEEKEDLEDLRKEVTI